MRRRYIQIEGKLIEVPLDHTQPQRNADSLLWNDRAYQDANDPRFSSRTEHREFMKRHGLTTVDDFKGQFEREGKRRAEFLQHGTDASRREDIARSIDKRHG